MNKPNFFIVGTPKAGTTSLYHYLEEHPDVYMSPIKETNYFSYNDIRQQGLYYNEEHVVTASDYEAQFANAINEKAIGEASVSYLFYPQVPARIKEFNPEAHIIIVLRNPVDRGFSHYLMDKRIGLVKQPLKDIIDMKGKNKSVDLYYQQYISLGLYYEQVKRYLDTFGQAQVKVFLYEDIVKDINNTVTALYNFLGVDGTYAANTAQKHNVALAPKTAIVEKLYASKAFRTIIKKIFGQKLQENIKNTFFAKEKKPLLHPDLKAEMQEIFREDILKTGKLLNKDLSHWL